MTDDKGTSPSDLSAAQLRWLQRGAKRMHADPDWQQDIWTVAWELNRAYPRRWPLKMLLHFAYRHVKRGRHRRDKGDPYRYEPTATVKHELAAMAADHREPQPWQQAIADETLARLLDTADIRQLMWTVLRLKGDRHVRTFTAKVGLTRQMIEGIKRKVLARL